MNEQPKQTQQQPEDDSYKLMLGGAGVLGGGNLASKSVPRILGRKNVFHGTGIGNVESIKQNGLQSQYGGTERGTARFSDDYKEASKGKVHVTSMRPTATMNANYAGMTADQAASLKMPGRELDNLTNALVLNKNHGHVFKANMDYDKWRSMEIDPDTSVLHKTLGFYRPNTLEGIDDSKNPLDMMYNRTARDMAVRGDVHITPQELKGNGMQNRLLRYRETAENLPGYIKRHPGRFGAGIGGLAAGGAAMYYGAKQFVPQEKEAGEMYEGLLKIAADYEKGEQVRQALTDKGRPIAGDMYGEYVDREAEDGAIAGGLLGAAAGFGGTAAIEGNMAKRKLQGLQDDFTRDQAEQILTKGNSPHLFNGVFEGHNSWDDYHQNQARSAELSQSMLDKAKQIGRLTPVAERELDLIKMHDPTHALKTLRDYHLPIRNAALGAVIGAGTLGAAAGARAVDRGAEEMGIEDTEVAKENAPLGETVGTLGGGLLGAASGRALLSKTNLPMPRLLGAVGGMYAGRVAGNRVQNHLRDEE